MHIPAVMNAPHPPPSYPQDYLTYLLGRDGHRFYCLIRFFKSLFYSLDKTFSLTMDYSNQHDFSKRLQPSYRKVVLEDIFG